MKSLFLDSKLILLARSVTEGLHSDEQSNEIPF